jgi:hypothetical protein
LKAHNAISAKFVATMVIREWDILFNIINFLQMYMKMDFELCDVYKVERR